MEGLKHSGSWESWLGLEARFGMELHAKMQKKLDGASGTANYIVYMLRWIGRSFHSYPSRM